MLKKLKQRQKNRNLNLKNLTKKLQKLLIKLQVNTMVKKYTQVQEVGNIISTKTEIKLIFKINIFYKTKKTVQDVTFEQFFYTLT